MPATILVADDEASIVELARLYLSKEGFRVHAARDGQEALELTRRLRPDLIVLDLMMPRVDGWEVCRRLRREGSSPPIIMLTARTDEVDKIVGLELGADDYLGKPFNPRELVARVKAILRRTEAAADPDAPVNVDDLQIDPSRREVAVAGAPVQLRSQEFELLLALARGAGRVMTREVLISRAWGESYEGDNRTVDVHVASLREKLKASRVEIQAVRGLGYKLVPRSTSTQSGSPAPAGGEKRRSPLS